MIACDGVTVRIGPKSLLSGVSLRVGYGEFCALVGPNGAGKSTLLHVLAGDRSPTDGEVRAFGRPLGSFSPVALAKVRAVLPQEATLAFPFTALEVALLGRAPHVRVAESAEDFAIARRALAAVGLERFEHRLYTTLSGGERQRVQLARALSQIGGLELGAPRILLLDEPTSSLDPAHQHRTLKLARDLARDGASVLAVLHDLNLAAQYADAVAVLEAGELRACGAPEVVMSEALLTDVFGVPMRVLAAPWAPSRLLVVVDDARSGPSDRADQGSAAANRAS
jgi:iron complex transport system ATP-binding protein